MGTRRSAWRENLTCRALTRRQVHSHQVGFLGHTRDNQLLALTSHAASSEPDMGPLKPYGTALLTREIPSALMHEQYETGDMDRSIMGVELRLGRGGVQTVWVATTHLESAEGNGRLPFRSFFLFFCTIALNSAAASCSSCARCSQHPLLQEGWTTTPCGKSSWRTRSSRSRRRRAALRSSSWAT